MKNAVKLICVALVLMLLPALSWAQDAPAEAPVEQPAGPSDPADEIVVHVDAMTTIVRDNLAEPEKVKTELKQYIEANQEAMTKAGERFEAKLSGLSVDEAEQYKETFQRKVEQSLEAFLTAMLDFSERHPEAAKELDEMLQKVQ